MAWAMDRGSRHRDDTEDRSGRVASITLTTDQATGGTVDALADALHAAGVVVERRAFLPARGEEQHPSGVLLLATSGPPLPLARLVAPAAAPAGVASALAAALGVGERSVPATLQLKADGVFVSVRGRDLFDITQALDALPAQLVRLDTRREERRLVYSEGVWRIDP